MSTFAKAEVPSGPVPRSYCHVDCAPESAGLSSARLQRLEEWQAEMVTAGRLPCTHLKILREGKVVYNRATGYENLSTARRVREDTIYRMYSMTKPIVVSCVALPSLGLAFGRAVGKKDAVLTFTYYSTVPSLQLHTSERLPLAARRARQRADLRPRVDVPR